MANSWWNNGSQNTTSKSALRKFRFRPELEGLENRVTPATFTWTGGASDNLWSSALNWDNGGAANSVPQDDDDVVFPSAYDFGAGPVAIPAGDQATVNDIVGLELETISFTVVSTSAAVEAATNYSISGEDISLQQVGGAFLFVQDGTVTINTNLNNGGAVVSLQIVVQDDADMTGTGSLILNGDLTNSFVPGWTFDIETGASATVNGTIEGGAGNNLVKGPSIGAPTDSEGTLTLTANNSAYLGDIFIQDGTLVITNVNALGSGVTGDTTIGDVEDANLVVNIPGGTTNINEFLNFDSNGGATSADVGSVLQIAAGNIVWTADFTFLNAAATSTIQVDAGASLTLSENITQTQGFLVDTGNADTNIRKTGTGSFIINSDNGAFDGNFFILAGAVRAQQDDALGQGVANIFDGGALEVEDLFRATVDPTDHVGLDLSNDIAFVGTANTGVLRNVFGNNLISGDIDLAGGGATTSNIAQIDVPNQTDGLALSGTLFDTGTGGFNKTGPGGLGLYNDTGVPSSYTGSVNVAAGILAISAGEDLGTDDAGTNIAAGAALVIVGVDDLDENYDVIEDITLNGGALPVTAGDPDLDLFPFIGTDISGQFVAAGQIYVTGDGSPNIDLDGTITLTAASTIYVTDGVEGGEIDLDIFGAIVGTGDLTLTGDDGTGSDIALLGTADANNTFVGKTTVDGIDVFLGKTDVVLPTAIAAQAIPGDLDIINGGQVSLRNQSEQIANTSNVSILDDSELDLDGFDETINNLTLRLSDVEGPGTLTLLGSTVTVTGSGFSSIDNTELELLPTGGTTTFNVVNSATSLSINAEISGTANIVKNGLGLLDLDNENSYVGNFTFNAGVLDLEAFNAIPGGTFTIGDGVGFDEVNSNVDEALDEDVTVVTTKSANWDVFGEQTLGTDGTGTQLQLNGGTINLFDLLTLNTNVSANVPVPFIATINGFGGEGVGAISLEDRVATFTVEGEVDIFAPFINGGITKEGTGKLHLFEDNFFTSPLTVNTGELGIFGFQPDADVNVNAAGTLVGDGTIGNLTVVGGTVDPEDEDGGTATLSVIGNASFASKLHIDALGETFPLVGPFDVDNDVLSVSGNVTLAAGTTLEIDTNNTFAPQGTSFTVLVAGGEVTGAFTVTPSKFTAAEVSIDGEDNIIVTQTGKADLVSGDLVVTNNGVVVPNAGSVSYGTSLVATFTLQVPPGGPIPGQHYTTTNFPVIFTIDGVDYPVQLTGLTATMSISPAILTATTHTISARYADDFYNQVSDSQTVVVNKLGTTTTLAVSNPLIAPGGSVTLTATVTATSTPAGVAAPSGEVVFSDASGVIGTAVVGTNGKAILTLTSSPSVLQVGVHNITAQYVGDLNYTGSTSAASSVTVEGDITSQVGVARSGFTIVNSTAGNPGSGVKKVTKQSLTLTNNTGATLDVSDISLNFTNPVVTFKSNGKTQAGGTLQGATKANGIQTLQLSALTTQTTIAPGASITVNIFWRVQATKVTYDLAIIANV